MSGGCGGDGQHGRVKETDVKKRGESARQKKRLERRNSLRRTEADVQAEAKDGRHI